MFERFTDRARRVVVQAQEASKAMGHGFIGTEHLLHGIAQDGESDASRVLRELDVTSEQVIAGIVAATADHPVLSTTPNHVPFTPKAKNVLELALRESLALGQNYIGAEHIFLAILRREDCVGAEVLSKLGVGYEVAKLHLVEGPGRSAATGDGRVRVTQLGDVITMVIDADASVLLEGYAFGGEEYSLKKGDKHTLTITLTAQPATG